MRANVGEELPRGRHQDVAVRRSAAFARRIVIMGEPTAPADTDSGELMTLLGVLERSGRIAVRRPGRRVAPGSLRRRAIPGRAMPEAVGLLLNGVLAPRARA